MSGPAAEPSRPNVTPAQIGAALIAGVPLLANLGAAFGVFVVTPAEQHALTEALTWATVFAGLLVGGDAHLRGKRNDAVAAVAAAAASPPSSSSDKANALEAVGGETKAPDRGALGNLPALVRTAGTVPPRVMTDAVRYDLAPEAGSASPSVAAEWDRADEAEYAPPGVDDLDLDDPELDDPGFAADGPTPLEQHVGLSDEPEPEPYTGPEGVSS